MESESSSLPESTASGSYLPNAKGSEFWVKVLLSAALSPLITLLFYRLLAEFLAFDVQVPNGMFVSVQRPECLPERREHFFYFCSVLIPITVFMILNWILPRGHGLLLSWRPALTHFSHSWKFPFIERLLQKQNWRDSWGWVFGLVAGVLTATYLLPSLQTEQTLPLSLDHVRWHFSFIYGEFAAVLSGRVPWVDVFPQYQNLIPTLFIPYFKWFGFSVGSFTALMVLLSWLALMCVYFVLRTLSGSSGLALLFYLPFLGMSFSATMRAGDLYVNPFTYYPVGPLRYFFPWITLFALSAYFRSTSLRRLIVLGFCASIAALNNMDFGVAAFLGVIISLIFTDRKPIKALLVLSTTLAFCFCIWSLYTWRISGVWLNPAVFGTFQKIYAYYGFGMLPMNERGWHWLCYLTLISGLFCGVQDALRRDTDRHLSAVLLFVSVFGFVAGMYFVGRSHPDVLNSLFSIVSLCLVLLCLRHWRIYRRSFEITLTSVILFLAWTLLMAKNLEMPAPLGQLKRLSQYSSELTSRNQSLVHLILQNSPPESNVEIIYPYGFELARRAGVINQFPFIEAGSLILVRQIDEALQRLDRLNIRRVYGTFPVELRNGLLTRGFHELTASGSFEVWAR